MTVSCDVVDDIGIASVAVRINEEDWKTMVLGEGDSYSYTFTDLAVGTYDVDILATDSLGLTDEQVTDFEIQKKDKPDDDETDYTWLYIVIVIIIILIIVAAVFMSRGGGAEPAPAPPAESEMEEDEEDEDEEDEDEEAEEEEEKA